MISFKQKGDFSKTIKYLNNNKKLSIERILRRRAQDGVRALSDATPMDTGITASSWSYKIEQNKGSYTLSFYNSNIKNGAPIAILIQYGHATRNGGWVQGRDYINPAIRPIFDKLAEDVWKEVRNT